MSAPKHAVEVPVAEHIQGLRERTAAAFNIASAHAREVDVMLRCRPDYAAILGAAATARDWTRTALEVLNELVAAERHAGILAAESQRAQQKGEMQ